MRNLEVTEPQTVAADDTRESTIGYRFERAAASDPLRPAIVTPQRTLTYGELNAAADSVAAWLSAAGLDQSRPIALMIEDPCHFAAAMLGAAKSGHMFIPFETSAPPAWYAQIIELADVQLVLADAALLETARQATRQGSTLRNIESIKTTGPHFSGGKVAPATPAYILYTSGSSGRPKGVVIGHRAAVHHVDIRTEHFGIQSDDRFALLHSPGFAAGSINLLVTLLNGACLFPFPLQRQGLHKFAGWINENRITSFSIVGSLFRTWLAQLPPELRLPSVRLIIPTSEALYGSDVARMAPHLTGSWKLGHILAITETGTVCGYTVDSSTALEAGVLPVGKPLRDMAVRLENDNGEAVPAGQIGEIVVRSRYIAHGYWREPTLTAAAFRTDPSDPEISIYRTGDLGRLRSDGLLEHLGRRDRKVKLRGFSVELYEVESAILRTPGVRDVSVSLYQPADAPALLVAYVVADQTVSKSAHELGGRLAAILPERMIPSRIMFLDELPLTARGKVDRGALPAPESAGRDRPFRAAANPIERKLAAIWGEVFGDPGIGIDDDFYHLGGSSLQAFTIFARIAERLGRDLPPTLMMRFPTIAKQAEFLTDSGRTGERSAIVSFRATGEKPPLFIVHGGGGDIMFGREVARDLVSDRPIYGLQPPPLDGTQRLPRSIETMAASYDAQIRAVQPSGPYYLSGYSSGGFVALEMAQRLIELGERVAFLGLIDTNYDSKYAVAGERAASRVNRHVRHVLRGPLLPYFKNRFQKTVDHHSSLWREAVSQLPNDIRYLLGRPVPHDLRTPYYRRIYFHASRRYSPQAYPGTITMFCRTGTAAWHRKRWLEIARGGIIVMEIPADHREMVWPPYSSILARAFDECLDGAGG